VWSAVGHFRMDVVQHDTLPEHARMHCCDGSMEISEGSTELRCTDTGTGPLDAKAPKDIRGRREGVKNLVMQWFWL
jgi:hypothetical protein